MFHLPHLISADPELDKVFRLALGTLAMNLVPFHGGVPQKTRRVMLAGLDYDSPWTRDAAFNTWFAAGMLAPQAAKNSLLAVLEKTQDGRIQPGCDSNFWDAVIWFHGAWEYFLATGDKPFLVFALPMAEAMLAFREKTEQDPRDLMFRGGACFQDGISAYPDDLLSAKQASGIIDCALDPARDYGIKSGRKIPCKALSTNALYFRTYDLIAKMRKELRLPENPVLLRKKEAFKQAFKNAFFDQKTGSFRYLLDAQDPVPERQETLGNAFVLLFGLANAGEIASVVRNAPDTPHGAPCVWPMIERYAPDVPRHSGTIWPQVNAAWCLALAQNGFREEAYRELKILTDHVYRDCGFFEIYHPETGLPYGGVQENDGGGGVIRWYPRRGQLWCATGLIGMVLHVFFGLDPRPEGLVFHPWLPEGLPEIRLNGLPWRNTMLNLRIRRSRKKGGKAFFLPGSVRGRKLVDLTV